METGIVFQQRISPSEAEPALFRERSDGTDPLQKISTYTLDLSNGPAERSEALWTLIEERARRYIHQTLPFWLLDGSPLVRARLALSCDKIESSVHQQWIAKKLQSDISPEVRKALAGSLEKCGGEWSLNILASLLRDKNYEVRKQARASLLKQDSPLATKILLNGLKDSAATPRWRGHLAQALGKILADRISTEIKLEVMDLYLAQGGPAKKAAFHLLVQWGLMDIPLSTQLVAKYGDPQDSRLTVGDVRRRVRQYFPTAQLESLPVEQLFPLLKVVENLEKGNLKEIVARQLERNGVGKETMDLKKLVSFSPYLNRLLSGFSKGREAIFVAMGESGEFQMTIRSGSKTVLEQKYRVGPPESFAQAAVSTS